MEDQSAQTIVKKNPENTILVLDFDDTLFKSKLFKKNLLDGIAENLDVEPSLVREAYDRVKSHGYSTERHVSAIKEQIPSVQEEKLTPFIAHLFSDMDSYLFKEVTPVLESFKKKGITMILLTYGDHEFQSRKISGTGLVKFFQKIVITTDAKSIALKELFRDTHRMIAVDNTVEHLNDIKKEIPAVETIAINRYDELQEFEAIPHQFLKDLRELEAHFFS